MRDWVHSFGHCLVSHILWHIAVNSLTSSDPACFKSSAGTLSTPGDLPAFNMRTASSTSSFNIPSFVTLAQDVISDPRFVLLPFLPKHLRGCFLKYFLHVVSECVDVIFQKVEGTKSATDLGLTDFCNLQVLQFVQVESFNVQHIWFIR